MHLEEMGQKPGLAAISNCLLQDLNKRFTKVKDTQTVDFDPLHVAATYLDPRYKLLLASEQIEETKNLILCETPRSDLTAEPGQTEVQPVEEKEPLKKCFKHLAAVIARKKDILTASATGSTS